jgi:hypothetical protein
MMRPTEIRIDEVRPCGVRRAKIRPAKVRAVEVRINEDRPAEVRAAEARPYLPIGFSPLIPGGRPFFDNGEMSLIGHGANTVPLRHRFEEKRAGQDRVSLGGNRGYPTSME